MSIARDVELILEFFPPPPYLAPHEAKKKIKDNLNARRLRKMVQHLESLGESGRKAAALIGPECMAVFDRAAAELARRPDEGPSCCSNVNDRVVIWLASQSGEIWLEQELG